MSFAKVIIKIHIPTSFIPYLCMLKTQKKMKEEWFPLVNEEGETIGKATRRECHSGSKQLHPVIHLHIFNDAGELYLQKRSMNKDIQPGKWDTAVGGHIDYGETGQYLPYRLQRRNPTGYRRVGWRTFLADGRDKNQSGEKRVYSEFRAGVSAVVLITY